jgi:Acetyltransferase (GNAT) family
MTAIDRADHTSFINLTASMTIEIRELEASDFDGMVVGAVLCGTDGRRGYLQHLAVAPSHQRRGIGRELAARCVNALAAEGIDKCHVMVLADNNRAAAFWTRIGWAERPDIRLMSHIASGGGIRLRLPTSRAMIFLRTIVILLALVEAGWMAYDGTRALTRGDYVTPTSGPRAGALGPWQRVVSAVGIAPRSTLMKGVFVVCGLTWLAIAAAFILGRTWAPRAMLIAAVGAVWYLPIGTVCR